MNWRNIDFNFQSYQKVGEGNVHKIEDEGLRESMHKCISRYTRANSEVIENKVKSDLFEDLKSGLRSFAQDLEDHKRKD